MLTSKWFAVLILLLLLPIQVWACACCSSEGAYHIRFAKPTDHELSLMQQMRFGGTAQLFLTEADSTVDAKGVAQAAERYSINGALDGNIWKLTFRDQNRTGTLNLPLPLKMLSYVADIRDGQKSEGGGPLLYKEWRFEGRANGTGIFKPGMVGPVKYFLVLQGRGNGCDSAEQFGHWRLEVTGRKADYAFYGDFPSPQ